MFFEKALIILIVHLDRLATPAQLGGSHFIVHIVLYFKAESDTLERHIGVFRDQDHAAVCTNIFQEKDRRQDPAVHLLHVDQCRLQAIQTLAVIITAHHIVVDHDHEAPTVGQLATQRGAAFAVQFRGRFQAIIKERAEIAVDLACRKPQLAGGGFFTVEFLENFHWYSDRIILEFMEALWIVQENVSIKDKNLGLGRGRFFVRQSVDMNECEN